METKDYIGKIINVKIIIKDGKSPEYIKTMPGVLNINAVYKNNENYLDGVT